MAKYIYIKNIEDFKNILLFAPEIKQNIYFAIEGIFKV